MNIMEVVQNEVKSFLVPKSSILYVSKEIIMSKNVMYITIFFSGGQSVKLSFTIDAGLDAYLNIRSQLDGTVYS
jgi:hypothetical protein